MTTPEFQNKLIHLQKHLRIFAFSLTSDDENARDLLQETNLKALNYCDRFVCETNFKAWTFTIMKNTFINDYRRRLRNNAINNYNDLFFNVYQTKSHSAFNPDSILASKELEKTIESIDEKLKVPFKMKNEGFKYNEIAEIMNFKESTSKSQLSKARRFLRMKIQQVQNSRAGA